MDSFFYIGDYLKKCREQWYSKGHADGFALGVALTLLITFLAAFLIKYFCLIEVKFK